MSLDELARRLEANGMMKGSNADAEKWKVLKEYFTAGSNMDSKTNIPNAAALAAARYLLKFLSNEYGEQYVEDLRAMLRDFEVLSPSEMGEARNQVAEIMKGLENKEKERGKSILDRLNQT